MSSFEDSYKSQLQGVSQQIARERLDGQVTAQENMLSDPVTNLRRRPGAAYVYGLSMAGATADTIKAWDTDLAGIKCHIVLNIADGTIRILSSTYALLGVLSASSYLTAKDIGSIQAATVGDELFICNTEKLPTLTTAPGTNNPAQGFYFIKAGAFSKEYSVKLTVGAKSATYSTSTPDGTHAGDASLANPLTIAQTLATAINADTNMQVVAYVEGQNVYLLASSGAALVVDSGAGSSYVITSGRGYLRDAADLPSKLPAVASGYVISTGALKAPLYYTYNSATQAWLESGDVNSPSGITNIPVSVTYNGTAWVLNSSPFEGRLAGDDTTNPAPQFVTRGITGISNYQGRLVLLSGPYVDMSASAKPRRFFRSSIASLLDSDCIEVGASAASSASYRYAVPFGRDLLLFSSKYQAVIPGSNAAITPRTATVVVTSTYDSDMTSSPTTCGRSLMYAAPRSKDFFGMLEMMPSTSVENQYTSYDSTAHLPKYMAGRCRFGVSSSVANMVLFAPSNDRRALIVHEYTWRGDEKVQQAWHKWTFPYPVAAAYFSGQTIHILFVNNGKLVACTIDPRAGSASSTGEKYAMLDFGTFADVVGRSVAYPTWLTDFDPAILPTLRLAAATGSMAGAPVGCTASGTALTSDLSFVDGRVAVGLPYTSTLSPTPPMKKDTNGVQVSSNKLSILHFMVGTSNSAEYSVQVQDTLAQSVDDADVGTLTYSSNELALDTASVGGSSVSVVPCRTNASSTSLVISTSGVGELNIVSLEYVGRYHEKIKRAYHG